MSKKIVLIVLAAAFFSSCKKTYTCTCTTVFNYPGQSVYYESNTTAYSAQMTKRKATSACEHEGKNINTTYTNIKTNNGQVNNSGSNSTNCTLK